jgi:hypothetical protein
VGGVIPNFSAFTADTLLLPHFVPNAGIRLRTPESVLVHTGDTGPTDAPYLLTARLAGRYAQQAGVARLLLTHLWPGTEHLAAEEAAAEAFDRPLGVATPGLVVEL